MRKFFMTALAVASLSTMGVAVRAEDKDSEKAHEVKGVLIDNACGGKKSEAEAAKHPQACTLKDGCASSGYQVVSGDKHLKFDEKGNELAKKYLAMKDTTTHVLVIGSPSEDGKSIMVKEIKPAKKGAKDGDDKSADHEDHHEKDSK